MDEAATRELQLSAVIGFQGKANKGLILHPDNKRLIYALGYSVVVRDLVTKEETFLQGHNNVVTCVALSKDGKILASGQKTHTGFVADIVIWNLDEATETARLSFHKVSVECLDFSCDGQYLVSLGGEYCNTIVLWSVGDKKALCSVAAALENAKCLAFLNENPNALVSAGTSHVRIWEIDEKTKSMTPKECKLGKLRRTCNCIVVHPDDDKVYCGTQSGDVLEVSLFYGLLKRTGPPRQLIEGGITNITFARGDLLVGSGKGRLMNLSVETLEPQNVCKVNGAITSAYPSPDSSWLWVGTDSCDIYRLDIATLTPQLKHSGHAAPVNQIIFPEQYSDVFATCSGSDIRVWRTQASRELLRIQVPGVTCLCVDFGFDGSFIASGWSDSTIRVFTPQTGRLLFEIKQAHKDGVTALKALRDGTRLASGGVSGEFRVWKLHDKSQELVASKKEHRGRVSCLKLRKNNLHAATASEDGTIIVWDMTNYTSVISINESTSFKCLSYFFDEIHMLATGCDRKVHYFDAIDGSKIREIEAAEQGEINCIDLHPQVPYFCTGGDDRTLRIWAYEQGTCVALARGHTDGVRCARFSPDGRTLISAGATGAIYIWNVSDTFTKQS